MFKNYIYYIIFLFYFNNYSQNIKDLRNKTEEILYSENFDREKFLKLNEKYLKQSIIEDNYIENFNALNNKTFVIDGADLLICTDNMQKIAYLLKNDSLINVINQKKQIYYYKNRVFDKALELAIESQNYYVTEENLYQQNVLNVDIGNIYFHVKEYSKAESYFLLAKNYFLKQNDYMSLQGYISCLYSLGKVYWQTNDIDNLKTIIKESESKVKLLNTSDQKIEIAYLNFIKAGLYYLNNDYKNSHKLFNDSLYMFKELRDFTNEHVIYLYLAKIGIKQNQKSKALEYLNKIDDLFESKTYLNFELREAYDILIDHYKNTYQPLKQLEYTEKLIHLNKIFEKEQKNLTYNLYNDLEVRKLIQSKNNLQVQLKHKSNIIYIWIVITIVIFVILIIFYKLKDGKRSNNNSIKEHQKLEISGVEECLNLNSTDIKILELLAEFESSNLFLKPLTLNELAEVMQTNRATLSRIINSNKGGNFNYYINKLRVQKLLKDLETMPNLKNMSIQGIAETYGFGNAKTFTNVFKSETGFTPASYLNSINIKV